MESIDITASTKFPINDRKSFVTGEVSDKEIEENFKSILSEKKNGEFIFRVQGEKNQNKKFLNDKEVK